MSSYRGHPNKMESKECRKVNQIILDDLDLKLGVKPG